MDLNQAEGEFRHHNAHEQTGGEENRIDHEIL
jgi:hypothetical protein